MRPVAVASPCQLEQAGVGHEAEQAGVGEEAERARVGHEAGTVAGAVLGSVVPGMGKCSASAHVGSIT
jgi:hypothetical protein